MTHAIRPASTLDVERLAGLFTAAYENYLVPFQVDVPTLRFMVEAFDLDLDASRVAFRDGEPVALGNLGLRGDRAWIGGIGVIPAARRQGLGEALMHALIEEARVRRVSSVWLEVIVENEPATRLYEKLGFERTREVEVWALDAADVDPPQEVDGDEAHRRIARTRLSPEPWQRADATLRNIGPLQGAVAADAAALFRIANDRVSLLQVAGGDGGTLALVSALRARGSVSALNLPAGEPAAAAFRALGGKLVVRQHEMLLRV